MPHTPVLLQETIKILEPGPGKIFFDATYGGGGHSKALAEKGAKVIAFDWDPTLESQQKNITLIHDNFAHISKHVLPKVNGILADLGISSLQLDHPVRGFSFRYKDAPLDMRISQDGATAADIVNGASKEELKEIFWKYGEERRAAQVAQRIFDRRRKKKFETISDLSEVVEEVIPRKGRLHPVTKIFQALRIAVNHELENLQKFLEAAPALLSPGGRIVVISFHSLEDRIVKRFFANRKDLIIITKKPLYPSFAEVIKNSRARSAKLRAAKAK